MLYLGLPKSKGSDVWTPPVKVADGVITPTLREACWNPVLFQLPKGELMLFYKRGDKVANWTGWLIRSKNGGKTWSSPEKLPDGFLGPVKNKPEYINGRIICPSSTEGENGWRIHFEISDDRGKTWRKVGPLEADLALLTQHQGGSNAGKAEEEDDPEGGEVVRDKNLKPIYAIQPSLLKHKDGRLQILCRTRNGKLAEAWSADNGDSWTKLRLTEVVNNNSGTDAVTLKDGRHLLVYNDFGALPGTRKGVRTPLSVAISEDGMTWDAAVVLEDSPISQYSYPSVIQGKDGKVHIVYTWRRQRIKYVELDVDQL